MVPSHNLCDKRNTNQLGKITINVKLLAVLNNRFIYILNYRVRAGSECAIGEEQCGLRHGRGCMDQVFAVRQVCEKYLANYYYYLESAVQGRERVRTLSVQRSQPHTTNSWKEEKDKTIGDKNKRADHPNRKAFALLLKPASPTGSLRSFQRDTERGTKLLRY